MAQVERPRLGRRVRKQEGPGLELVLARPGLAVLAEVAWIHQDEMAAYQHQQALVLVAEQRLETQNALSAAHASDAAAVGAEQQAVGA